MYAWFQGGESRMEVAEKNLFRSIDQFYELYYLHWSFLLEVLHFYRFRMEEAKTKFFPTEEEKNPSLKLSENMVIRQLEQNHKLSQQLSNYKISWTEEQEMVRKVYQKLKTSKEYQAYLRSGISSYQEDQEFVELLYRKFIAKSADFQFYCEERNIHWEDDFESVAMFVIKTIRYLSNQFTDETGLTDLFRKENDGDPEEDHIFIVDLFRKTIMKSADWDKLIETRTRNWEIDRIALTDILLIKMALTELTTFSQIPVKVTLNEYIDISKQFSSAKSKSFINGILDSLVTDLNNAKMIRKTGRGLMT